MHRMGWVILIFSTVLAQANDPCGKVARESVMGQTAGQLLKKLALGDEQKEGFLKISEDLETRGKVLFLDAEVGRQRFFDAFLKAAEDGTLTDGEAQQLTDLQGVRMEKREALLGFYMQCLDEAEALLTENQSSELFRFRADIVVSKLAAQTGGRLVTAYRKVRDAIQENGTAEPQDVELFKKALDEARGVVFIPFWLENTIDMMLLDYDAYRDEFLAATRRFRVMGREQQIQVDLALDSGISLLTRAAKPQTLTDEAAANFHLGLLVSFPGVCLMNESM